MTKPLVVYYCNIKSLAGEIAHKLALTIHGDIYEVGCDASSAAH